MKSFAAIVGLLLIVTVHNSSADLTKQLIGTWTGKQTVTYKGKTTRSTSNSVIKPFEQHGLIVRTTVNIPDEPQTKSVARYYDSGKFRGVISKSGETIAVGVGTWKGSGDTLTTSLTIKGFDFRPYEQSTKMTLTNRRKIHTVTTTSNGLRGDGTMLKR